MDSKHRLLQLKCLEIFDIAEKICREHHIQYSLCGGSVVGALLYKGFIPWDDDIDLMMTRENFNRFFKIAERHLPKGYSLVNYQNSDFSTQLKISFCKIIDNRTTIVQTNGDVLGVSLDITVYDKVPNGLLRHIDLFLCKRILAINTGKVVAKGIKNQCRNFFLSTILSDRRKFLKFFQFVAEILGKTSSHYTYRELFGAYPYYNTLPYKSSIFEHYITIEFEGRQVMIVRDYIEYLQTRYNRTDFHEPAEKQVPVHYEYMNLDIPYQEFLSNRKKNPT